MRASRQASRSAAASSPASSATTSARRSTAYPAGAMPPERRGSRFDGLVWNRAPRCTRLRRGRARDERAFVNVVVEGVLGVRSGARRQGLRRGRTMLLASGDLIAMTIAYALTYVIADRIGSLPAVSAPTWVLVLLAVLAVPGWLAIFTAYHLYDNDALRISVASFDEVRDIFHAILAGSLAILIVSQGLRYAHGWWISSAVEAALFLAFALVLVPVMRGSTRSWILPRVMAAKRV